MFFSFSFHGMVFKSIFYSSYIWQNWLLSSCKKMVNLAIKTDWKSLYLIQSYQFMLYVSHLYQKTWYLPHISCELYGNKNVYVFFYTPYSLITGTLCVPQCRNLFKRTVYFYKKMVPAQLFRLFHETNDCKFIIKCL